MKHTDSIVSRQLNFLRSNRDGNTDATKVKQRRQRVAWASLLAVISHVKADVAVEGLRREETGGRVTAPHWGHSLMHHGRFGDDVASLPQIDPELRIGRGPPTRLEYTGRAKVAQAEVVEFVKRFLRFKRWRVHGLQRRRRRRRQPEVRAGRRDRRRRRRVKTFHMYHPGRGWPLQPRRSAVVGTPHRRRAAQLKAQQACWRKLRRRRKWRR